MFERITRTDEGSGQEGALPGIPHFCSKSEVEWHFPHIVMWGISGIVTVT